ncbi:hypothetical protein G3O08_05370 [Cryomorpha ignava]|uniref:Chorismate-utilising enzyme C-terminal domain-containing protein n=1 Tax=Cryomorpha ignava TaxID=101383 RepID=A0A7K3WMP9_9FLAO|nr:chorismate-binding protein [Cryomorpha ignava]NEN22927.1 hypothetical protein [Cryomorpha ignava]
MKTAATKLRSKEPFCIARFPGEKELNFYQNPTANDQNKGDSFLVKGWITNDTTYYYASAYGSELDATKAEKVNYSEDIPTETSFETYSANFNSYQHAFANTSVKKVILSRIKLVDISTKFDLLAYFERLESAHPNALVFMLLHPTEGLWIGATPEILISRKGNKYTTVSLAATQRISEKEYHWGAKEKQEQEYVSAHIRKSLAKNGIENFTESRPATAEAGSVAHLKTIFEFEGDNRDLDFLNIADQIHPTPAISGTPVSKAIDLINATENHLRRLYTGYLGRISAQSIDLYVNLRCMQVFPTKMVLYLGGGITQESQLEDEWDETEQKAKTLLKQING